MEWTRTTLGGALIALLLGLLLGLERQRVKRDETLFAGIRTFPLFALCGFLAALAAGRGVPLALPAVLLAVAAYGLASYLRAEGDDPGVTTEMTAVLAALLGATVAWGEVVAAASAAVVITLLLTLKAPLHRIAGTVSEDEILVIVKFGLVTVVLVPLLPDKPVGPHGALVPRQVGLVVVILSGVSLAGYLLVRIFGGRTGWALAAAVIVLARVAQEQMGRAGLWTVGAIGGLVDVDSVAVAAARVHQDAGTSVNAAAGAYLLATVSNLLFKGGAVVITARGEMARRVLPAFGAMAAATAALLLAWP